MSKISCIQSNAAIAAAIMLSSFDSTAQSSFPPMPEAVTSFGAVTCNNQLYVFGGHQGERHDYSAEKVSGSFHSLDLSRGKSWEKLPGGPPAQGLALVAHENYVYRIGGMAARNADDAKQDLHSMAVVQRFDIRRNRWEDLAPLPAPRSSHDAVVVGNRIYVAGGWHLNGAARPVWPEGGLVYDIANPSAGWREFPQPFKRRALALATDGERVFCIGGMDSDNETTLAVDIYNTGTGQWTKGPDLPKGKHKGFSCSAIAQGGRVYVNMFQGDLLRLSADERSWEVVGRVEHPRLAHRIVTFGASQLIALGGEDGEAKRPELELLTPAQTPIPSTAAQANAN